MLERFYQTEIVFENRFAPYDDTVLLADEKSDGEAALLSEIFSAHF